MKSYKFLKTEGKWYIDLPEYLEQGGSQADLQMVDGADQMLDIISDNQGVVQIFVDREKYEGGDLLALTEKCDPYIGGGMYFMKYFEGKETNLTMWLCQVTEFVFGDLPEKIYVKRNNG